MPSIATWDGGGVNNKWTTIENWVSEVAPQPGDDLVFPNGVSQLVSVNDFAAGTAFRSLAIDAPGYQLSGDTVNLSAGLSADIATGGTAVLNLEVDGVGGLTKSGGGTLALGSANTYTGLTDVQAGTLDAHSGSALGVTGAGNDTLVHDGAALALSGDIVVSEAISFSGRGATIDPGQALSTSPIRVLFGNPTLSGPLNLSADASIATAVLSDLTVTGTVGTIGGPWEMIVYGNTHFTSTSMVNPTLFLASGTTICDGQAGLVELAPNLGTGEVLGGTGHVGQVIMRDGVMNPGVGGPGVLTTGDLDMGNTGVDRFPCVYHVDLATSGGQIVADKLDVHGTVLLRVPTLTVAAAPALTLPSNFHTTIIGNDGTDPVANTFAFFPEGSIVQTIGGTPLRITYHGGDGNDVELYTGAGGTVSAFAYIDANLNGHYDSIGHAGEQFIPGVQIYADLNNNGRLDPGEPSGVSPGAQFNFTADGAYVIRSAELPGARRTSPAAVTVNVFGGGFFGAEFGFDVSTDSSGAQELLAVGADAGGGPHVKVYNPDGILRFDFMAYNPNFRGGVRVATADVTGDGTEDIITAPGPGGGPHIKVFDGRTGNLVREWMAYDSAFTGGVYIAAWRGHNANRGVIVTGAGAGGGPHVKVFDAITGDSIGSFFAYDQGFRGGVTVALSDFSGDMTFPEIVTGAGPGGGPHVKVFDGQTHQLTRSFFAFDAGFRGGVNVAVMNTNHDSRADIVVGAGAGGAPLVRSFDTFTGQLLLNFLAFDPSFRGGVRVGTTAIAHQFDAKLVVAPGPGGAPYFRVLTVPSMQDAESLVAFDPAFLGGVFVG